MRILKKNLSKKIKEQEELWCLDESRFGTHSKIGRGWFKSGIRTPMPVKLGFKNFYLYSAVNPKTGEDFTLILPNVNTVCMNLFLKEFSKYIGRDRQVVIMMDGAGWHKSRGLMIPKNMRIIIQPAYSPELNPVEKLWQYIKDKTIKNKVYDSLTDLQNTISAFILTISAHDIQRICNINYALL